MAAGSWEDSPKSPSAAVASTSAKPSIVERQTGLLSTAFWALSTGHIVQTWQPAVGRTATRARRASWICLPRRPPTKRGHGSWPRRWLCVPNIMRRTIGILRCDTDRGRPPVLPRGLSSCWNGVEDTLQAGGQVQRAQSVRHRPGCVGDHGGVPCAGPRTQRRGRDSSRGGPSRLRSRSDTRHAGVRRAAGPALPEWPRSCGSRALSAGR